jgi:hypothetical protein
LGKSLIATYGAHSSSVTYSLVYQETASQINVFALQFDQGSPLGAYIVGSEQGEIGFVATPPPPSDVIAEYSSDEGVLHNQEPGNQRSLGESTSSPASTCHNVCAFLCGGGGAKGCLVSALTACVGWDITLLSAAACALVTYPLCLFQGHGCNIACNDICGCSGQAYCDGNCCGPCQVCVNNQCVSHCNAPQICLDGGCTLLCAPPSGTPCCDTCYPTGSVCCTSSCQICEPGPFYCCGSANPHCCSLIGGTCCPSGDYPCFCEGTYGTCCTSFGGTCCTPGCVDCS